MAARVGLAVILALAAALRLWRLEQNGFGNEYYSAGVRSMSLAWRNFLYHAFDPAGFVSVDKPPVAMWIQVGFVKLLGFRELSVLLPQVLEGVAAVWVLHHLVRRSFGPAAGLLAALFLALTPVSVAVDRSSNTESCLVLVLLLAAWALVRAAEEGRRRFLVLAMALVGLGFNVKMLAAFVVLPAFALVLLLGADAGWRRRLGDLALAGLVLVAVSASWVAVYELTPPERRPYAGTTDTNSELELVVGPYGIGRFVRQQRPSAAGATAAPAGETAARALGQEPGPRRGWTRLFVGAPAGPLRLLDGQLAGQVGWLFPLALAGLGLGARGGPRRRPLSPAHLSVVLWSGWTLTYAVVYSAAGGFFHFYYLAMLAPPLAALAGIGAVTLGRLAAAGGGRAGLAAVLAVPVAWTLSSVLVAGHGALPSADLARLLADDADGQGRRRSETATGVSRLADFLVATRQGERYLLATSTTMLAAPIIIRTGQPVMARGGFHGLDSILTPETFARMVAAREIRFAMVGDLSLVSRRLGAETAQRPITEWVHANGRPVDASLWRAGGGTMRLYDLRPDRPLVAAPAGG